MFNLKPAVLRCSLPPSPAPPTWQMSSEMDNVHMSKLVKDCGLLGPGLTSIDVDIIFTKVGRGCGGGWA